MPDERPDAAGLCKYLIDGRPSCFGLPLCLAIWCASAVERGVPLPSLGSPGFIPGDFYFYIEKETFRYRESPSCLGARHISYLESRLLLKSTLEIFHSKHFHTKLFNDEGFCLEFSYQVRIFLIFLRRDTTRWIWQLD